jgi:hypothetical protein
MVFDYVAVEDNEIISEGKIVADTKERALLKVGALLAEVLHDEVEVIVRPF